MLCRALTGLSRCTPRTRIILAIYIRRCACTYGIFYLRLQIPLEFEEIIYSNKFIPISTIHCDEATKSMIKSIESHFLHIEKLVKVKRFAFEILSFWFKYKITVFYCSNTNVIRKCPLHRLKPADVSLCFFFFFIIEGWSHVKNPMADIIDIVEWMLDQAVTSLLCPHMFRVPSRPRRKRTFVRSL